MGLLLEAGAKVDGKDSVGGTALHAVATLGYWDAAALLLEAGAKVDVRNAAGATPLQVAIASIGDQAALGCVAVPLRRLGWRQEAYTRSGVPRYRPTPGGRGLRGPNHRGSAWKGAGVVLEWQQRADGCISG